MPRKARTALNTPQMHQRIVLTMQWRKNQTHAPIALPVDERAKPSKTAAVFSRSRRSLVEIGLVRQLLAQVSLTAETTNVPTPPDVFNGFQESFAASRTNNSIDKTGTAHPAKRSAEDFRRNKEPRRLGADGNVSLLQQRMPYAHTAMFKVTLSVRKDAKAYVRRCSYAEGPSTRRGAFPASFP